MGCTASNENDVVIHRVIGIRNNIEYGTKLFGKNEYTGQMVNGLQQGYGIMKYGFLDELSGTYEGEWFRGNPNGKGIRIWIHKPSLSDFYKKNGIFKECDANWINDKPNGHAKIKYSDDSIYFGVIKGGRREGHGVMTFSNNNKYEGFWKDDLPNGWGKLICNNGKTYVGNFKNGFFDEQIAIDVYGNLYIKEENIDILSQESDSPSSQKTQPFPESPNGQNMKSPIKPIGNTFIHLKPSAEPAKDRYG